MKIVFSIILWCFLIPPLVAQFSSQKIITDQAMGARAVFAADIDADGFIDVVTASSFDNTVAWYKNLNGTGNFGTKNTISSAVNSARTVYAADINGDSKVDVVSAEPFDDTVDWFENIDGIGNFGSSNTIGMDIGKPLTVIAADLDGDGDKDIIAATFEVNRLIWYENQDGLGSFGSGNLISIIGVNGSAIVATDIDSDGDLDIASTSSGSTILSWFENLDGQGSFSNIKIIDGNGGQAKIGLFAADIDGDNDIDLITASVGDDRVSWYENLNGFGDFGEEQIISTEADFARTVFAADLDNDGDVDVLSSSAIDNKIAWYENLDGQGTFGIQNVITTDAVGTNFVHAADLDNDGDIDVLSASQTDHKIAWYENLTILGTQEFEMDTATLYPNPAEDILYIQNEADTFTTAIIHTSLGKNIGKFSVIDNMLHIQALPSGLYFLTLISAEGRTVHKKFLKE